MIKYVLRPLAFASIKHESSSLRRILWHIPVSASVISTIFLALLSHCAWSTAWVEGGAALSLTGFIETLPGFFLAALAAVSTFDNPRLDQLMDGKPPRMKIIYNGALQEIELTRRRFVCSMFSYLTATSIIFIVLAFFLRSAGQYIPSENIVASGTFFVSAMFLLFTLFWQIVLVSFYGLYYLGEKILEP